MVRKSKGAEPMDAAHTETPDLRRKGVYEMVGFDDISTILCKTHLQLNDDQGRI